MREVYGIMALRSFCDFGKSCIRKKAEYIAYFVLFSYNIGDKER